jgi:hypothetical protein
MNPLQLQWRTKSSPACGSGNGPIACGGMGEGLSLRLNAARHLLTAQMRCRPLPLLLAGEGAERLFS